MRFIHSADWQIGMRAVHVGAVGREVREARLAAAGRVIAAAREQGADFILLAGDTFEDNAVDPILVRKIAELLAAARVPVFLLPGNHDPLVPGSIYDRPVWGEASTVTILREAAPVDLPGGTLYPCPARERQGGSDPTDWIARAEPPGAREDHRAGAREGAPAGIRIGMAHGTLAGIQTAEPEYPIARDAAERAGLDYLALGHWHSTALYPDAAGAVRMAYAGTHEPTSFGERDSGNALLIEVAAPGAPPAVTPIRTGGLRWLQIDREIRARADLEGLRAELEAVEEPARALVALRLSGVLADGGAETLEALEEVLTARFLYHRFDADALGRFPADDAWLGELPAGVLREAAAELKRLADPAHAGARPEEATARVAAQALIELYALARESRGGAR